MVIPVTAARTQQPGEPFKPKSFHVLGPTRGTTTSRPRGPIFGDPRLGPDGHPLVDTLGRPLRDVIGWKEPGKSKPYWDLRVVCDGHRWRDRHYSAGRAKTAKDLLEAGFHQGLRFDPKTVGFISDDEAQPSGPGTPTVFTEALAWWAAHWSTIEPKSRKESLRYITRPIREHVQPGDPPDNVDAYLLWQMLPPKAFGDDLPEEFALAATWLRTASLPVEQVGVAAWQTYVDRWRVNSRNGRPLAQASVNRHLADVKQMWSWVCAVHGLADPWNLIKSGARSSAGGRRGSTVKAVDRSIVLAPDQIRELAEICGRGSFGPLAEIYILLLGIAGGRPGESAGVHANDLEVSERSVGKARFSRTSRRNIGRAFLDADDDADWGPLKGREIEETRLAPLPSCDSHRIFEILAREHASGELFRTWDWDKFSREVWGPGKEQMAQLYRLDVTAGGLPAEAAKALLSTLERLRLHDLRHAACSMWLNTPGVEVKVACEWSGHKRLSVFLDIYQGIMPGSRAAAEAKLDAAWGRRERSATTAVPTS